MSRSTSTLCGLVATAGMLAAAPAARAQGDAPPIEAAAKPVHQPFEVGVFGGVHLYEEMHGLGRATEEPSDNAPDHGGAFGLRLGWYPLRFLGIEAEGMVSPTRTRGDATNIFILGYRGNLVLQLPAHQHFMPFALVGYGALSSFPGDTDIVPRDTDGMFNLGVGAKFPLNDRFGIRIDGRVMAPAAFAADIVEVGDETFYDGPDWEALASVYLSFGGASPPPPPRPLPPPPVEQDRDNDGILDRDDKCPTDPEDKDGFEDDDGCPEPDNDKDGIADANDKCPTDPEDKDGFEDDDGCPEPDNDKDGIADANDKCPDMPETRNQYQDEDGCPDEVPAAVKKFTGVIQGINFKTGSAEILKGSFAILDRAVAVLKEYPDVKLEISGHTDDVGKDDYNKALSQRRADSVKNYLVSKGIAENRLRTVGYGEEQPIADNKTKEGKAKNRRTEFKLID